MAEQRYQAVMAVIGDGLSEAQVAEKLGGVAPDIAGLRLPKIAGTSITSMPSARSRLVSGTPTPPAASITQPAMGHWRAKRPRS